MKLLKLALLGSIAVAMIGRVSAEQLNQQIDKQISTLKKQPGAGTVIKGKATFKPVPARSAPQARNRVRDGLIGGFSRAVGSQCGPAEGAVTTGVARFLDAVVPGGQTPTRAVYRNKRYPSRIALRALEKSDAIKKYQVPVSGQQSCPCPAGTTRQVTGSERKFNIFAGYDFTIQYADCVVKSSSSSSSSAGAVS